jgi:hypothetical protein
VGAWAATAGRMVDIQASVVKVAGQSRSNRRVI